MSWQFWIDTGGTFTDCLARDPESNLHRCKVLSTSALRCGVKTHETPATLVVRGLPELPDNFFQEFTCRPLGQEDDAPETRVNRFEAKDGRLILSAPLPVTLPPGAGLELRSPEQAPLLAIRRLLGVTLRDPLPPCDLRLATTRATNTLLERKGAPTAFLVTRGFRDLLIIGDQRRPELFALDIAKPEPLYQRVREIPGRLDAQGRVAEPLDEEALARVGRELVESGISCAAVAFAHSYRNPAHEQRAGEILRAAGVAHVILSSDLARRIGLLRRAQTTVAEAFLRPILREYCEGVTQSMERERVTIMNSRGGLEPAESLQAKDSLLSGPAGGIVGAAAIARRCGSPRCLTFDMGGTSTDVARVEKSFDYQQEQKIGDAHVMSAALRIETIASGGGSICSFDGRSLQAGPESAGASPGPACYGAGGPLTLTDVNLLLGRLDPERFNIPVDLQAAQSRADELCNTIPHDPNLSQNPSLEIHLEGLLEIANEKMAEALRKISVREGFNPAEYALVSFGGAGGLHACALARRLGISRVLCPADSGILSAYGLSRAELEEIAEEEILAPLEDLRADLPEHFERLITAATHRLPEPDRDRAEIRRQTIFLRFNGQESALELLWSPKTDPSELFQERFAQIFGFFPRGKTLEIVRLQVVVAVPGESGEAEDFLDTPNLEPAQPTATRRCWTDDGWSEAAVFAKEQMRPGESFTGPALVQDRYSTVYIATEWRARVGSLGTLELRPPERQSHPSSEREAPEAVTLELFTRRFESLVGQMGELLRRTALSTNIRERLDFSCALLDPRGRLVANAPHIPVHLGALGLCVRRLAHLHDLNPHRKSDSPNLFSRDHDQEPDQDYEGLRLKPGEMWVTNHPAFGGSHLPDVTVVCPVFNAHGELLGFCANRAHHAEIGGARPGSMPPGASNLAEEGVVLPPIRVMRNQETNLREVETALTGGPWPTRNLEDNLIDMQAQIAANRLGARILSELATVHGSNVLTRQMHALAELAANTLAKRLPALLPEPRKSTQTLENGARIVVRLAWQDDRLHVDFTGTSPQLPDNFNATPAIVQSTLIYVLRLLLQEDLPLNEGLLRDVGLTLPRCFLNPAFPDDPTRCPAVVAGNVETSQRLTDALLQAFGVCACSQGTMNNVVFGNERFGYYETLGGGAGATANAPGASAVHVHMTNTAITDPEILEHRYPVVLEQFSIRTGSGGAGRHPGGNGLTRRYRFLEPLEISLLTQRRTTGPEGLHGGRSGKPGEQFLRKTDGTETRLDPSTEITAHPGDLLTMHTPGGGGWG